MMVATARQRTPRTVKAAAPPPVIPPTHNAVYRAAMALANEAGKLVAHATETWERAEHARFVAAGGCTHCHGRGWVVTWDTLDIMDGSCATYGTCTYEGCTREKCNATGYDNSVTLKHDRWNGAFAQGDPHTTPMYKLMVLPFEAMYDEAVRKAEALAVACVPRKASKVVVVKGRKVAIGTIGRIAYVHDNGGVLVKSLHDWEDRKAPGQWIDPRNLEVVL